MADDQQVSASTQEELEGSMRRFAGRNGDYYAREFIRIQSSERVPVSFNWAAAAFGPLWSAARGLWGMFWVFVILELVALVQLGRGLWGNLGADELGRYQRLTERSQQMLQKAEEAAAAGQANAESLRTVAGNMERAAEAARAAAEAAASGATRVALIGLALLLAVKLVQGFMANLRYERLYSVWRTNNSATHGFSVQGLGAGVAIVALMMPLTLYRFTSNTPPEALLSFPANKDFHGGVSKWLDVQVFDALAQSWSGVFDGITGAIRMLLDSLEVLLVGTPWPVTMIVIVAVAWRLAGVRVAIFTVAALAYLALFGFWEKSMITVALLGAAAVICIAVGIPIGIWCAKSPTAYAVARPILDFMQTMPAFVYLIPVIAFFGTGKPPGILATLVFGMPPVIRLTALGVKGVPEGIKEAAIAFGCNKRKLLWDVEIPLALPSIMTGVNQTILMCLSMVVIASLIGAEGLGSDVLLALQYAAKGQGLLAGLAILFCAMVIDRVVQGRFKRDEEER